jgi:hypothetical protein
MIVFDVSYFIFEICLAKCFLISKPALLFIFSIELPQPIWSFSGHILEQKKPIF